MKIQSSNLLFFGLLIMFFSTYGQTNTQEAKFKDGDAALTKFLDLKFHEEAVKYEWPTCTISAVFVKFTIDSVGNIKTLSFSELKGTPQVLKTMLRFTILKTNGLWIPKKINGKAVESKHFILPLIYDMESGCKINSQPLGSYKPIVNGIDTDLLYMLDFDDSSEKKTNQLECILLRPLRLFSIN